MFKILIASIFFLLIPQAQSYQPEDFRFNHLQYIRYVKPQVKNLLSSYQKILLSLSNKKLESEKTNLSNIYDFIKMKDPLFKSCKIDIKSESCHQEINKCLRVLTKLQETSIKSSKKSFLQFSKKLEMILFKQKILKDYKVDLYGIQKEMSDIYLSYNLKLIDYIPEFFRPEFHGLWTNFIYPLTFELKDDSAENFFIKNTTILNRAWNLFHVRISKRGFKVEKKNLTFISLMHSRWNQVLKIVLKR